MFTRKRHLDALDLPELRDQASATLDTLTVAALVIAAVAVVVAVVVIAKNAAAD